MINGLTHIAVRITDLREAVKTAALRWRWRTSQGKRRTQVRYETHAPYIRE